MNQMQQWHPDLGKPTVAREERARPSSTKFCPRKEAPSAQNGATPPTKPRWAPSGWELPGTTRSWRFTRSPAPLGTTWTIRSASTATRSPNPWRRGRAAGRRHPSRLLPSPHRRRDRAFRWRRGAGPAFMEAPTARRQLHGVPVMWISRWCWRTQPGSSTTPPQKQVTPRTFFTFFYFLASEKLRRILNSKTWK